jgi:hypothetical protein
MNRGQGSPGRLRPLLIGGALAALLAMPGSTLASTDPETPPPSCDLGTSTLEAGTPLELSGTDSPDQVVGVVARRDDGQSRDVTVTTVNGAWHAVLLFGVADGGSWLVAVGGERSSCASPLTVILPAGVVAPPTPELAQDPASEPPAVAIDGETVWAAVWLIGTASVAGSWIMVVVLAVSRGARRRLLARRSGRLVARGASFVAVLGGCLAAWLVLDIAVSLSHFDTGPTPGEQRWLDLTLWAAVVGGSVLGTLLARRLRGAPVSGGSRG